MCLYHSKTLLVKKVTFLYKVWPDSAEKRDILNTGNLDTLNLILKICSSVNCLSPVKAEHWIFQTVIYSWMGGIRRIEQANSRLTEL